MTDKECIEKIEAIAREYFDDEDGFGYMDKVIDILEEYNRSNTFNTSV